MASGGGNERYFHFLPNSWSELQQFLEEEHHQLYTQSVEDHVVVCKDGSEPSQGVPSIQDHVHRRVELQTVGKKFDQRSLRYSINGREESVRASLTDMFDQMDRRIWFLTKSVLTKSPKTSGKNKAREYIILERRRATLKGDNDLQNYLTPFDE
ncbi:hypothetical protein B9Z55_007841 [Caenorhabditis nigoni]|uniref:Uncharacterized protein n=1 Tax=Caenorhabditis nigoni TaxID=1611254 RepID=A0A2G5VBN0_9PELO|nr:hypothetical protein B9Z55_007841 [Caenorhabditis nigoni]